MATGINSVTIVGNLGAAPELRHTSRGQAVTNLRVAINGPNDQVDWITVVAWNATAEACAQHLEKGALIGVEGRLSSRSYERNGRTQYVTEVIAHRVSFLSPRRKSQDNGADAPPPNLDAGEIPF